MNLIKGLKMNFKKRRTIQDQCNVIKSIITPVNLKVFHIILKRNMITRLELMNQCETKEGIGRRQVISAIDRFTKYRLIHTFNASKKGSKIRYKPNISLINEALNLTFNPIVVYLHNDEL